MSVISNECVVFSIGENINPNDEIFNFANFIRILDDLYKEEEVALVKFIEEECNISSELPVLYKEGIIYDEETEKILEDTFKNSKNLGKLFEGKKQFLDLLQTKSPGRTSEISNGQELGKIPEKSMVEGSNSGYANISPKAHGYRNLKKSKKGKKKPKTKKKGGAAGEENHNLFANAINYVQLGMLGITLLYGIYTAVRNKVCGDEESADEEDYRADLKIPAPIPIFHPRRGRGRTISQDADKIFRKTHIPETIIPELGKIILSKDFRRTVSLVVLDPRKGIISGNIKKCVVKYTTNRDYSRLYSNEANVYDKLESTRNIYVISKHNSGSAVNNNGKAVFSFNNSKFSLNLDHGDTNFYLILEYNKNYITLEKYGDLLKKKRLNITEKLEEVLRVTYRVLVNLQDKYNFFHTDLKKDNIMVTIDDSGDFMGVKFFDFDLASVDETPYVVYRGWQDDTEILNHTDPEKQAYFILLDMWRLWLSLKEAVDVVEKRRKNEFCIDKYINSSGKQKFVYLKFPHYEGTSNYKLEYPNKIRGKKFNFTLKKFDDLYKEILKSKFKNLYINSNNEWNKYWMSLKFIKKLYNYCCIKNNFFKRNLSRVKSFSLRKSKKIEKAFPFVKPSGSF